MSKFEKYACLAMCYMELAFYEFLIWISKMSPVDKRLPMMHMWEDMRLIITSYIEEFEEV